jgi:hypothetical protein
LASNYALTVAIYLFTVMGQMSLMRFKSEWRYKYNTRCKEDVTKDPAAWEGE